MIPMFGSRRRPVMQRPQHRPVQKAKPVQQAKPAPQPVHANHNLVMTSRSKTPAPAKKASKPETAVLDDLGSFEKVVKFLS